MELDCFVMFSSVSSIFGNPAQGNYSAANAFIDALAHHRQALGLPALTVNWGVLGGEGYVARNERVAEFLARQGTMGISPGEAMSLLESFLARGKRAGDCHPGRLGKVAAILSEACRRIRSSSASSLRSRIRSRPARRAIGGAGSMRPRRRKKQAVICQAVREAVGSVLRVKPDSLRDDQPLTDLGLDSLMGVEIETSLEAAVGVALPPTSLMRARTIGQIALVDRRPDGWRHDRRGTRAAWSAAPARSSQRGGSRSALRRRDRASARRRERLRRDRSGRKR